MQNLFPEKRAPQLSSSTAVVRSLLTRVACTARREKIVVEVEKNAVGIENNPGGVRRRLGLLGLAMVLACGSSAARVAESPAPSQRQVLPGITVLLRDSVHLLKGKRFGLLTNQTGIDEKGRSDIDLLANDSVLVASGARLVKLFSPEHGIRGTEDRTFVESGRDARSGLVIHSLYGATTLAPPDSTLNDIDALVFDLQDIGTRTWTYVGNLVYALRAAQRNAKTIIVLDRPNPIGGHQMSGPMLDASIANAEEHSASRPARPYALYPFPLRHGMTMAEMALFYNSTLGINADLRVVPMAGWRRSMWFDDTGLPWLRPSPNMPSLNSALLYPALVPFEGTNVSVGRGTDDAFQRFGASWLNAEETARLLELRFLSGVSFVKDDFTPKDPGDGKFAGRRIAGVKIVIVDRERVQVGRISAAILWAIRQTSGDSLRITDLSFDLRFGDPSGRRALLGGDDPDSVIDRAAPGVLAFGRAVAPFLLYER